MAVADNIKRIRKERELTQKQLGELCNPKMAESTVRQYELGLRNPKLETIARIAKALNCSILDLTVDPDVKRKIDIHVTAIDGIVAILEEMYGYVIEKNIQEEYGESFYYLVGKGKNSFVLYEGDMNTLLEYIKSSLPFVVNNIKDCRPEQEVIDEIRASLTSPAYIKYIKEHIGESEK